jgi:SSS family solute:Na+ symporter
MAYGTCIAYGVPVPGKPGSHFGGPTAVAPILGQKAYIALTAFVVNVVVVVGLTVLFRALRVPDGNDQTVVEDYVADAGEADVRDLPEVVDLTAEEEPSPASGTPTSRGR